jgi:RNA polymerase sigma-70 factor (ECF subfamily)
VTNDCYPIKCGLKAHLRTKEILESAPFRKVQFIAKQHIYEILYPLLALMEYMSGHTQSSALGIVLSLNQDNVPGLSTAAQELVERGIWTNIVERIRAGDPTAPGEFYTKVMQWLQYCSMRRLEPNEAEDRMQDTYLATLKAIQNGELREPERLMGFMRVIGYRHYCASIKRRKSRGHDPFEYSWNSKYDPEKDALEEERRSFTQKVLARLAPREREILERFYLREERVDWICKEMKLTRDQFRLFKWRAKAKVAATAKKSLKISALRSKLLRAPAKASLSADIMKTSQFPSRE